MDTPRLIARDDLVACLDRAAARKVTIICAPAGSGKTSLLGAWADRPDRAHRLAVVQVRRDQHDAQLFWLAVLNAVRQASGTTRDELPAATPDFNGRAMVDRVLSELAEHRGRVVLVIDDVHELASTEALAQLTRLLVNLPSQAHAIVSTRRDLWLGLHQLRLADELAVRRGHRAGQRPARGGADEPGDRRGVVPGASGRRTPPAGGRRPGPGDRPALPRGRLPGGARVRVEDPPVRRYPGALPRGDSSRRSARLGEGTGELSVSVNTVSTHIRSIYAKLGADDRSAAVRRARELRLLSAVRTLALRSSAHG